MKKFSKILIIGAGQIGSRHLQGLLKSHHKLLVTIVDPCLSSLKIAKLKVKEIEIGNSKSLILFKKKIPFKQNYKICIISTSADVRAKVTKQLVINCKIEHIIFEKILFQKINDYKIVYNLLKQRKITAWVNCPRRNFSIYKKLKKQLDNNFSINMKVEGSFWGMACNSIHYIDLFSYLTNCSALKIKKTKFINKLIKAKRGIKFYEVNGEIQCAIKNHSLDIACNDSKSAFLNITITNKKNLFFLDELNKILKSNFNNSSKSFKFKIPYQSELSKNLIDNLINRNKCDLISFKESCNLHLPFIFVINKHFSKIFKKKIRACPIT